MDKLFNRHAASNIDTVGHGVALVSRSRQDEAHVGVLPPQDHERVEQSLMVLVWPAVGWVEQEGLACIITWRKDLEVGAKVHDTDAVGVDTETIAQCAGRVFGDSNHKVAVSSRSSIDKLAIGQLGLREELRQVLVLDVTRGIIVLKGKCNTSSWSMRISRRIRPPAASDEPIAKRRPGVDVLA